MRRAAVVVFAALLAACGSAPRRDLDFDRLHASLQALATDPELAKLALAERALAEAAVRRLDASSINAKEHAQLSYLAERRVDIAYIAAQTEQEKARLAQLQREHAELLLAASRRETQAVRAELDRQRRDALLQQEEAERSGVTAPHAGSAAAAAETRNEHPAVPAAVPPAVSLPDVEIAKGTTAPRAASAAAPIATAGASAPPAADGSRSGTAPDGSALPVASSTTQDSAPSVTQSSAQDSTSLPAAPSVSPSPASPSASVPDTTPVATPAPVSTAPGTADTAVAADLPLAQRLAALTPDADGSGAQVTLEDLVFEPGTATFAAGAEIGLKRVAAWLAAAPAQAVRIEGHTDATGSPEANLSLSLRRAEAVRDAVVARGVAAARIVVSGEGAADPVASNDDAQGRARNRRVVVRLLGGG